MFCGHLRRYGHHGHGRPRVADVGGDPRLMAAVNPLAGEAGVVIAPDSSGKEIRTTEVTTLIAGVPTVVEMQVMTLADAYGNMLSPAAVNWPTSVSWPGIS